MDDKITKYFQEFDVNVHDTWPLDFAEMGFATEYVTIDNSFHQAGMVSILDIHTIIKSPNESYVCNTTWQIDDGQINASIDELYRTGNMVHTKNFTNHLLQKMQTFLLMQDKSRNLAANKYEKPSQIKLNAQSKPSENSRGGMLWALMGFDFAGEYEQNRARQEFAKYAKKQGIVLATKDLKLFTKPCHFAAFDCGVKLADDVGRSLSLGKKFLLNYSWNGVWTTTNPNAEEKKYAQAYLGGDKNPVAELGSSYRKMLQRYTNKYNTQNKIAGFAAYKAKIKNLFTR